jgi:excisionase family DNA binding protein
MEIPRNSVRNTLEKYLTYKEISVLLNIPLRSLYQYNKEGLGPKTSKIGRHLRVAMSDLETWLNSNEK